MVHESNSVPFAVQRLQSESMFMLTLAQRLLEAAETTGDQRTIEIQRGVLECLKLAKQNADTLEVVEVSHA